MTGFLFPAGPRLVAAAGASCRAWSLPIAASDFLALAGATIRSVAQGVIGIAVAQGLVIGIILKFAGVPRAGLLAFAVMMLGIMQIGSAIVVIPVLIWIWATKSFVMALRGHALRFARVARRQCAQADRDGARATTPALVIFIGVIGGTLAHGIVGLFIGPIILAVAWELLTAWVRDRKSSWPMRPTRQPR